MDSHYGKTFGASLLIAGCCIGAGMLGLPVLTAVAGFIPSSLIFVICWLFMATTGLLLLEVNLWFDKEVNLISMSGEILGLWGKAVCGFLFAFLFYSLLVAYVSGSSDLIVDFSHEILHFDISPWICSVGVVLFLGIFLYFGTGVVDYFNRILMAGLLITYILLVILGIKHVNREYLLFQDWSATRYAIPAMIISFGYHNLIPSLKTYLKSSRKNLVQSILLGSLIPLVLYLIWEFLILGLVPVEGETGFRQALDNGEIATLVLRNAVGLPWIVDIAELFSLFVIVTSLLSVALSFIDFLADGLKIKKTVFGKILLVILVLAPPFIFSLIYPKLFLIALRYAGTYGAVTLFGIIPALMVWKGREKNDSIPIVPGGNLTLILVFLFSLSVILLEFKF